jgi:ABC-type sugar transport system ATPase subunit
MSSIALEVRNLKKSYDGKTILDNLSLIAKVNDFSVICGKPGSGKSVLVRTIMGLESVDSGEITFRGKKVTEDDAGSRNIGYIPQSFALYPHFSVRKNIEYPLDLIKASVAEKNDAVTRVSDLLNIGDLLRKKPNELSGGQKQRVAIARGLSKATDVYVLDDPLVGLDFKLRERLIDDLRRSQEELKVAFIYITSDPTEALSLAKSVFILAEGKIVQQGSLEDVYDNPTTQSSMSTLGFPEVNFISGSISDSIFQSDIFKVKVDVSVSQKNVSAGIRPEGLLLGEHPNAINVKASLVLMENLGSEFAVYLRVGGTQMITVVSRSDEETLKILDSKTFTVSLKPDAISIFDANSGSMIGKGLSNV